MKAFNHTDFVLAPLDQMFMMWSEVNRVSRRNRAVPAHHPAGGIEDDDVTIDPMAIKDIKVVEAIKEGKTIYQQK